jgi:maltose-binding protein MalE
MMSFKQKLEYFWDYYKIHTIAAVLLLIFIFALGQQFANKKECILYVNLLGKTINTAKLTDLNQEVEKILIKEPKKEVIIKFQQMNEKTIGESSEKIMVMVTAGDLDIIITDKDQFMKMAHQGFFKPLEDIKEIENLKKKGLSLVEAEYNGKDSLYGIDIENNEKLIKSGYDTKNKVMAVVSTSKRERKVVEFIDWIF